MSGGGVPVIRYDLARYGVVTQVVSPTQFIAAGLAGSGDQFFQDWAIFVIRKADGTGLPPQEEGPLCLTYNSATGTFTHVAFTVPLSVGDELTLLHPTFYAFGFQLSLLAGGSQVGVHTHADNNIPQLVFAWTGLLTRRKVHSIWLDFFNLTVNTAYILSSMIDGVNYRIFDSNLAAPWTVADNDGVLIVWNETIETDFMLQIQSTPAAEGAIRAVPYRVIYEDMT
jgi:hypothetical protein